MQGSTQAVKFNRIPKGLHPFDDEFFENYQAEFEDDFVDFGSDDDVSLTEIDFSNFKGEDFKSSLKKLDHFVSVQGRLRKKKIKKKKPETYNKTQKVIVPSDRPVIVQGVSNYIVSNNPQDADTKAINYYKGRKLSHLTLTFNNAGAVDFDVEIFNPSEPLDYLYSTSLDLNNKITVAGGHVKYSDVLHNLLANPTMVVSAQVIVIGSGTASQQAAQLNQVFQFKNKNISGLQAIEPMNVALTLDAYQYQTGIVNFDIMKQLNRPFVPDGMDVIMYKVLAGMSVVINFYYKQVQLKRMVFEECRNARNLL